MHIVYNLKSLFSVELFLACRMFFRLIFMCEAKVHCNVIVFNPASNSKVWIYDRTACSWSMTNESMTHDSWIDNSSIYELWIDDSSIYESWINDSSIYESWIDDSSIYESWIDNSSIYESWIDDSSIYESWIDDSSIYESWIDDSSIYESWIDDSLMDESWTGVHYKVEYKTIRQYCAVSGRQLKIS